MEELQLLVKLVADLPQMALWVLVGFFAYKVIVIGSLYSLIKFIVKNIYLWLMSDRVESGLYRIENIVIDKETLDELVKHIKKFRSSTRMYLYRDNVDEIGKAIDLYLKKKGKAE